MRVGGLQRLGPRNFGCAIPSEWYLAAIYYNPYHRDPERYPCLYFLKMGGQPANATQVGCASGAARLDLRSVSRRASKDWIAFNELTLSYHNMIGYVGFIKACLYMVENRVAL